MSNITVDQNGIIKANKFNGSGELLTNINATNITTGEISDYILPSLSNNGGIVKRDNLNMSHFSISDEGKLSLKGFTSNLEINSTKKNQVLMVNKDGQLALSSIKFASAEEGF